MGSSGLADCQWCYNARLPRIHALTRSTQILMFWLVMLVAAIVNAGEHKRCQCLQSTRPLTFASAGGVRGNYLETLNVASMWWTGASSIIVLVVVLAMCDDKRTGA